MAAALVIDWRGGHLGTWKAEHIVHTETHKDQVLWTLARDNIKITAIVRQCKSQFPCIADELKRIFGLCALGTHMICVSGKSFLLIKPFMPYDVIHIEETLTDLLLYGPQRQPFASIKRPRANKKHMSQVSKEASRLMVGLSQGPIRNMALLTAQVRAIYAFRHLIGASSSNDRHIRVRRCPDFFDQALSYTEIDTKTDHKGLPNTVLKKWFSETTDLGSTVRAITPYKENGIITERIAYYRQAIEETITRVNPDFIWLGSFIIERLMKYWA